MHQNEHFESGTATILASNMDFAVTYRTAFLSNELVLLWNVATPPTLKGNDRLRWVSADRKVTKYFRVIGVVNCSFEAVHVDLQVTEELKTQDEIKRRQDEVVGELNALAKPLFSDQNPPIPVPIEELFRRGERAAKRELLRQELGDLAAMLAARAEQP